MVYKNYLLFLVASEQAEECIAIYPEVITTIAYIEDNSMRLSVDGVNGFSIIVIVGHNLGPYIRMNFMYNKHNYIKLCLLTIHTCTYVCTCMYMNIQCIHTQCIQKQPLFGLNKEEKFLVIVTVAQNK